MSLSSSLFTGTSGLKNMGNALQVVGNNISNLNTIGFKRGASAFADTLYESVATQAGTDQMGRGMSIGSVTQNFAQGSFESTGNTTDLSIGGDGFFIMRQSNTENTFYTRAGNFFFDKDGQLVNPEGYMVQGWELDEETGEDIGAIKDLVLDAFTSPPQKSSTITAVTNLDADATSQSVVLSNNWDSGNDTFMPAVNYEYQTVVKVYDALGSTHDVTIFYDKKSGTEWEYVVACNPDEDNRNAVQGTDSKGLLARGTILFSQSSGDILDLTMSKFTGRLGNFQANGVNATDDIHYEILDYDAMPLDGYGFNFAYDGTTWGFADPNNDGSIDPATEMPENYPRAAIVYSDSQQVQIVLDSALDTEPDLTIKFDQSAVLTDTFGFDINNKNDLHVQNIEGTRYLGDTANDNTTLEINDPSVMTRDASNLGIVWNPNAGGTGEWTWSNPGLANDEGTLLSDVSAADSGGNAQTVTTVVDNPDAVSLVANGVNLRWNGTAWNWNDDVKAEDFTSTYTFDPTNYPSISVLDPGSEGSMATDLTGVIPELHWLGTADGWSLDPAGVDLGPTPALTGNANIEITNSSATNVVFDIWYGALQSEAASVQYSFGSELTDVQMGQSISFVMEPTPPEEYAEATIIPSVAAGATAVDEFYIDLEGDDGTHDITFNPAGVFDVGSTIAFSVTPDVPPEEYANATLRGDQYEAIIDLDGSGNDSDNDDIRFVFNEPLRVAGGSQSYADRSEISFDILGSTAWTEISKNDIEETGYYSFDIDFLGGEFGSTVNDIQLDLGTIFSETNFVNDSLSTTQYSKSSSTVFQDADGYSAGDLQGVDVASDGIMTGVYSNGQLIPLFRVGLAKFLNNYGLFNEGGNLFRETRDSGSAITNKPGENGLGTIAPNSLEMSNVDISEEFVSLITNQRGFQANSKTITTVDEMMQTVLQMK